MKFRQTLFALLASLTMIFGCGQKDSDIQANVDEKLKSNSEMTTPATTTVKDGVVTISGVCKDETCKAECEKLAAGVKGVKSVINNMTVPAPVVTKPDETLITGANQAVAAYEGVTAEVANGIITLRGSIKRTDLPKLMQAISGLQPKSVNNQLQVK